MQGPHQCFKFSAKSRQLAATNSTVTATEPDVFRDLQYYPVIMLPKKSEKSNKADQMRLHIQNKLSGIFGLQHMAKAIGSPSIDGEFIFALTVSEQRLTLF